MKVVEFLDEKGRSPFRSWLKDLIPATRARIQARIARFESGNLGDVKAVGEGVFEARIFFGPGYRIYYGVDGETIVVLLTGGDKSSQDRDIVKAKKFWASYTEGENDDKTN